MPETKPLWIQFLISITAAYPVHLRANDHTERKGVAYSHPCNNALLNYALLTNKLLS